MLAGRMMDYPLTTRHLLDRARDGTADTPGRAGDESCLAGQIEHGTLSLGRLEEGFDVGRRIQCQAGHLLVDALDET